MTLPRRVLEELASMKDGIELVSRFRRFLGETRDGGFATGSEVAALSEYMARVDALVEVLEEFSGEPFYVACVVHPKLSVEVFSDKVDAETWAEKACGGSPEKGLDEEGRTRFLWFSGGPLGLSFVEPVVVDRKLES